MHTTIVIIGLMAGINAAVASDGYIVERRPGATCPSDYHGSGSGCVGYHRDTPMAIPKQRGRPCPDGTHASGDFCEAYR